MHEIFLFKEIHGKPTNHCVVLAEEYGETKIVNELCFDIEDGSVFVSGFRDEPYSPDSDHISNVRILFFDTEDELDDFKRKFYDS